MAPVGNSGRPGPGASPVPWPPSRFAGLERGASRNAGAGHGRVEFAVFQRMILGLLVVVLIAVLGLLTWCELVQGQRSRQGRADPPGHREQGAGAGFHGAGRRQEWVHRSRGHPAARDPQGGQGAVPGPGGLVVSQPGQEGDGCPRGLRQEEAGNQRGREALRDRPPTLDRAWPSRTSSGPPSGRRAHRRWSPTSSRCGPLPRTWSGTRSTWRSPASRPGHCITSWETSNWGLARPRTAS